MGCRGLALVGLGGCAGFAGLAVLAGLTGLTGLTGRAGMNYLCWATLLSWLGLDGWALPGCLAD